MAEPQIHVDPDRLVTLADLLETFAREVELELGGLESGLASLGATWQDDEYRTFKDAVRPVHRILETFRGEIRKNRPKLEADAEAIRAYLRLNPRP
ncbi:MAG: hypothetical protein JWM87_4777 [Candidatus Eremiobacteraeota bacterium]|nr:hypothetical protein [Candidatus Eremiobacteraeota bacterium]